MRAAASRRARVRGASEEARDTGVHCGWRASGVQRVILSAMLLQVPPPLFAGDAISVVAPSAAFDRDALWNGLAWLRSRYRARMSAGVPARHGYLARSD